MIRKLCIPCLALLMASCLSEDGLDPVNVSTFTRVFSDGYENIPIQIEETPDNGFVILANTTIQNSAADAQRNRIVLIKTDAFGHTVWNSVLPDSKTSTQTRWRASSMFLLSGGRYLIAGEEIQSDSSYLLLLVVDANGVVTRTNNPTSSGSSYKPGYNMKGKAAILAPSKNIAGRNNYMVLGHSPDAGVANNLFLAEVDTANFNIVWSRFYVGGNIVLTNRLFYKSGTVPYLYWGGERKVSSTISTAFITQAKLDEAGTENGLAEIRTPQAIDHLLDFTPKGDNFGLVGYTEGNQLGNIFFSLASSAGVGSDFKEFKTEIFTQSDVDPAFNSKAEFGNSISSTKDGGFIILGTIDTYTGVLGQGNTDLLMLKVNGFGAKQWSQPYGFPNEDAGVCIRQVSDGGYVLLGYSTLAGLRQILLIKTDKDGHVN